MISKKLTAGLVLCGLALTTVGGVQSYAKSNYMISVPTTTDNKPNGKDPYSTERVSHPSNPFATCVITSTESENSGTITTQWMEIHNGTTNTSKGVDVKQSKSVVWHYANHIGQGLVSQTYHNITSENNNFNAKGYTISGTWKADNT
ncbi:hypothetical protein [Enterococcus sp.]|uniref:hypothetical protein n=1 Tax=Enterococcus sp. TaxID=35783 RepID=UPI003C731C6D